MATDGTDDWFERLTGFAECGYEPTRALLAIHEGRLVSRIDGRSHGVGRLELVSLAELRRRVPEGSDPPGRPSVSMVPGNIRRLHADASLVIRTTRHKARRAPSPQAQRRSTGTTSCPSTAGPGECC